MSVAIIDYGMGNLRSVQKAFEKNGYPAKIITAPREVHDARALVLPGVGAFQKCLQNLDAQGLIDPIISSIRSGKPFLGICLGLQILFTESEEFGASPGLDVIRGKVVRFQFPGSTGQAPHYKIPHMGWNSLCLKKSHPCLRDIDNGTFFYFVHSYYVVPDDPSVIATTTQYGIEFVSSICKDNIFACQFHPEKSQTSGLRLLKNFAALAG